MLKMIIVEDEYAVREGLMALDWNSLNVEIVGIYDNAIDANEYIKNGDVDAVLTDIRMPLMSGIELVEKVSEYNSDIVFIILSGYDDFNYVKKFLNYNVAGYLLKPIVLSELSECLKKVEKFVSDKENQKMLARQSREKEDLAEKIIKDSYIKSLLNGESDLMPWHDNNFFKIDFDDSLVVVTFTFADNDSVADDEVQKVFFELDAYFENYFKKYDNMYCYTDVAEGSCYVIINIQDNTEKYKDEIVSIAREIFADIDKQGITNGHVLICAVSAVCAKADVNIGLTQTQYAIHGRMHDERIYIYDDNYLKKESDINSSFIINKALEYINQNYNKQITLQNVADEVYVNYAYLSFLFKRITGYKFMDYLTNLRIEKAKEYLRNSGCRIGEIALMVGYDNSKYFNFVFKKKVGVTPIVYRNSN